MSSRLPVVCLDPGHGGSDRGADRYGVDEADLNLEIMLELEASLAGVQLDVVLTRDFDVRTSLEGRGERAKDFGADFVLSIHVNAHGAAPHLHGLEMYYRPGDIMGSRVSHVVANRAPVELMSGKIFCADTDNGSWLQRPLNVLESYTRHRIPAALVECGYLSNRSDKAFVTTPLGRSAIVCGLRSGVIHAARMLSDAA